MDKANQLIHQVVHEFHASIIPEVFWSYRLVFGVMALGYFTHWVPESWKQNLLNGFIRSPLWVKVIITVLVIFAIYQSWSSDLQPFIYFQF